MTLRIQLKAIYRATLGTHTGNEGWIGVDPSGKAYHVIVPVDTQIARGVMACNRPTDGTPFGGYSNWIYFRCQPYDSDVEDETLRIEQAKKNLSSILIKLSQYGIDAQPGYDQPVTSQASINTHILAKIKRIFCTRCHRSWIHPHEVLKDPDLWLLNYRADVDDFNNGVYVFQHACGGKVEVPVWVFIKPQVKTKSLAGLQACPGLCYYETSLKPCKATCEGSTYRTVAYKITSRHARRVDSTGPDKNETGGKYNPGG